MVGSIDQVAGADSDVGNFIPPLVEPGAGSGRVERKGIFFNVRGEQDRVCTLIRRGWSARRTWSALDQSPILKAEVTRLLLHRTGVSGDPGVGLCLRPLTLRLGDVRLHRFECVLALRGAHSGADSEPHGGSYRVGGHTLTVEVQFAHP